MSPGPLGAHPGQRCPCPATNPPSGGEIQGEAAAIPGKAFPAPGAQRGKTGKVWGVVGFPKTRGIPAADLFILISKLHQLLIQGPNYEIPGAAVPLDLSGNVCSGVFGGWFWQGWFISVNCSSINCSLIIIKIPLLNSSILLNTGAGLHPTEIFPDFAFSLCRVSREGSAPSLVFPFGAECSVSP